METLADKRHRAAEYGFGAAGAATLASMTHTGSVVDIAARTVRDREGRTHSLDRLELADGVLYHARPLDYTRFDYLESWIIPARSWAINRFRWFGEPEMDWYIEPERIIVDGDRWTIGDGLLDLWVFEGSHYRVDDADELADAIAAGDITLDDGLAILRNFQALERELRDANCSGLELLRRHASALAGIQTPARPPASLSAPVN